LDESIDRYVGMLRNARDLTARCRVFPWLREADTLTANANGWTLEKQKDPV
jgi:hypothetical protein